jgi:hypothetical protein
VIRKTNEEQDRAAGGEQMRKVKLPDGVVATASVSVQLFAKSHQQWGYLRFKNGGKTTRCYIGKVSADTLYESLTIGWQMVREKQVLERAGWSWLVPSVSNAVTKPKKRLVGDPAKRARQA